MGDRKIKFLRAIVGFLILLVLVLFFLSNRQPTQLNYWPFGLVLDDVPVAALVLAALAIGFLAGLLAHLPKRFGAQRRAKRAEKRVAELEGKLAPPATLS